MAKLGRADIVDLLKSSYDPDYYGSLFSQMRYAFGEPWERVGGGKALSGDTSFPYFPDITLQNLEVGQSRRIVNSQFIGLSRVMYNQPKPQFPHLPPMDAEARTGYFLARWKEGWAMEEEAAFMDGDGVGRGFLQLGLKTGSSGLQKVTCRYSPTLLTMGDRHERHPDKWEYICFVRYIRAEQAKNMWGSKADPYIREVYDGMVANPYKAMRVFDFYSLGVAGKEPTHAIIPAEFDEKPFVYERNDFETLPFSFYTHVFAPGMQNPIGRIILQMATQEALNEIEEYMRDVVQKGKPVDIAPVEELDEEDVKQFRSGKFTRLIKRTSTGSQATPWERIPPQEISQSTLAYLGLLERQFSADSGVTDLDRGQFSGGRKTATEVVRIDQRSQVQGAWSVRQAVAFRERTITKAIEIGARFDRDPVMIPFFGAQILVNDPSDPNTFVDEWLSTPSIVKIEEDSLTFEDVKAKRREMMIDMQALAPFVGVVFNPRWWGEKVLEAMGEKDVNRALLVPDTTQQAPMQINPASPPNTSGQPALPASAGF